MSQKNAKPSEQEQRGEREDPAGRSGREGKDAMKYVLNRDYRLRGWKGEPFFLERFSQRKLTRLTPEEFLFFIKCDGAAEIDPSRIPAPEWALTEGIVSPCADGRRILPEQEYKVFSNRRFHYVELSVTGRCNFRCRHCFNAADTNPRTVEPSLDRLKGLLADLDDCGVGRLRLVGGEPLVHPDFPAITEEAARRGMRMIDILTNGWHITPELLDVLERQGHRPAWFVSFDGLGHHDWLRGMPNAEEQTLRAIRLLCEKGYYVHVHQCVWRDSLDSVRPTVKRLRELGVARYRLTPVEPSLRWKSVAPEQTITTEIWQKWFLSFLDWWYEQDLEMDLDIWGFWQHDHRTKDVHIVPDISRASDRQQRIPMCGDARSMPYIDADGRLLFCDGLSGISAAYGIAWENVYETKVKQLFTDSLFTRRLFECTCADLKAGNPTCRACEWIDHCSMGCRAEALTQGNGIKGPDHRMCVFFQSGIYRELLAKAKKFGLRPVSAGSGDGSPAHAD